MKVLVADKFEKDGLQALAACGSDVTYDPDLAGDTLTQAVKESSAEVLVVRSTKVTAAALDAGGSRWSSERARATTRSTSPPLRGVASTSPIVPARMRSRWPSWRSA